MNVHTTIVGLLCAGTLTLAASAQTITRVTPNVGSPGDVVILEGSNLQNTTEVAFTARVGGFVGQFTTPATPSFVSGQFVIAQVPSFGFAPPSAPGGTDPLGSLKVNTSAGRSSLPIEFFYLQGTFYGRRFSEMNPQTETIGAATTQSNGREAAISFDISGGHPFPGNSSLVLEIENAIPMAPALLLIGTEAASPIPVENGSLVVDLFAPVIVTPPVTTDPVGDAQLPLAVPGPEVGVQIVFQWLLLDLPLPGDFAVTKGLRSRL